VEVLEQALVGADEIGPAALVTVVGSSGSTPRHVGAHMLVSRDGRQWGSVGGGAVEHAVVEVAVEVAGGAPARRVEHHLVRDLAMCCGGTMELYIEPLEPSLDVLRTAARRRQERQSSILFTTLDGSPKRILLESARRRHARVEGDELVEPVWPSPRLVLFGYGHLARAILPLAESLGFEGVVCDDNQTGAIDDMPPHCSTLVSSFALGDVEARLGRLGRHDYLLILTRDHAIDQRILEELLPLGDALEYLGLIGSLGKVGRFKKRILGKGMATEEEWKRLRAPMGLDIEAETPEEIAVSIMAELIARRNRGKRG
jgi:xanthine dehydrogenase accessory factor